jgi:hypothetical protein
MLQHTSHMFMRSCLDQQWSRIIGLFWIPLLLASRDADLNLRSGGILLRFRRQELCGNVIHRHGMHPRAIV